MVKLISFWKRFWLGIWVIVKRMGSWQGVLSLVLVWLTLSGAGVSAVGIIFKIPYLVGLGGLIFGFWVAPFTPLIPICIAIAMLFQRYVLRDKSIGWKQIKAQFGEAFAKDEGLRKRRYSYKDIAMKTKKGSDYR